MRYTLGILVIVLIAGGIFLCFNIGKNNTNDSTVTSRTTNADGSTATVTARDTANTKVLDLSNKGITAVDAGIYSKRDVTDLILSNNSIKTLPSEIGKMNNLVVFKIDHNLLDGSLIGEIRQMSKLKVLDVSYNKMTGMPAEIGQLSNLESLNYSQNNITGLPNELSKLKNNLKEFNLAGNPLSQDQMSKIKELLPNTNIIF